MEKDWAANLDDSIDESGFQAFKLPAIGWGRRTVSRGESANAGLLNPLCVAIEFQFHPNLND